MAYRLLKICNIDIRNNIDYDNMELDRNKSELTEHEREIANKLKDKINKEWECSDDG